MLEKISPLIPPETRIDYELLVSGSFTLPPEINIKYAVLFCYILTKHRVLGCSQIPAFHFNFKIFFPNYSVYFCISLFRNV